jgi:D-alanyl-D-alanine carboxypeptidase
MEGRILNAQSLSEMLTWQTPKDPDPDFFPISYGLGIFRIETPQGIAYMHSGDAIGYYANMLYFPEDSTTVVYAVNSNYGKLDALVSTREAMEEILAVTKP